MASTSAAIRQQRVATRGESGPFYPVFLTAPTEETLDRSEGCVVKRMSDSTLFLETTPHAFLQEKENRVLGKTRSAA